MSNAFLSRFSLSIHPSPFHLAPTSSPPSTPTISLSPPSPPPPLPPLSRLAPKTGQRRANALKRIFRDWYEVKHDPPSHHVRAFPDEANMFEYEKERERGEERGEESGGEWKERKESRRRLVRSQTRSSLPPYASIS